MEAEGDDDYREGCECQGHAQNDIGIGGRHYWGKKKKEKKKKCRQTPNKRQLLEHLPRSSWRQTLSIKMAMRESWEGVLQLFAEIAIDQPRRPLEDLICVEGEVKGVRGSILEAMVE